MKPLLAARGSRVMPPDEKYPNGYLLALTFHSFPLCTIQSPAPITSPPSTIELWWNLCTLPASE